MGLKLQFHRRGILPAKFAPRSSLEKFASYQIHRRHFSCEIRGWFRWFLEWCLYNPAQFLGKMAEVYNCWEKKCNKEKETLVLGKWHHWNFKQLLPMYWRIEQRLLRPARFWSRVCGLCLTSSQQFLSCSCQPFPPFCWKWLERNLARTRPRPLPGEISPRRKKVSLTENEKKKKKKKIPGEWAIFACMQLHDGFNIGSEKYIRRRNSPAKFASMETKL